MYSKFLTKASAAVMAAAMALNGAVVSTSTVIAADSVKYELEDAELTGTVKADDDKNASGGKIAYMTEDGTISLDVEVASAGLYTITIYAGGVGGAKQQTISINGTSDTLAVPESTSFEPIAISAKLNEGKNTIVITKSWGWTKFDYLTVETASLPDIKATQTDPATLMLLLKQFLSCTTSQAFTARISSQVSRKSISTVLTVLKLNLSTSKKKLVTILL